MDGREAMALSGGPASYYIPRGGLGSGSGSQPPGLHNPAGFRPLLNPNNIPPQGNVRSSPVGPSFSVEQSSSAPPQQQRAVGFPRMGGLSPGMPASEPVKKKRGRPRKYGPDGPVSLRLSSMSGSQSLTPGSGSPTPKRSRGRPPGSGRKQQLANLGEWMNSSAGIAFAPHVITVGIGEDIVAKLLSFAQQRPRALCILSGSGAVSSVSLRQPASTGLSVAYEGRFQILCLSGSYLVAEDGGPRNRTGGVSVSLCSHDGHVIGGGAAVLIAASAVQVVVCSFVHGNAKVSKSKQIVGPKSDDSSEPQLSNDNLATPTSAPPSHSQSQSQGQSQSQSQSHAHSHGYNPSGAGMWPGPRQVDLRGPHTGIDLTRG